MPRAKKQNGLSDKAINHFEKMRQSIDSVDTSRCNIPFDFSSDIKRTKQRWSQDKNIRDILICPHAWHQLLFTWLKKNPARNTASFLPSFYNWRANPEFLQKHQNISEKTATALLKQGHPNLMTLIGDFSNAELFTKKYYLWTGMASLASYCISVTANHKETTHKYRQSGMSCL